MENFVNPIEIIRRSDYNTIVNLCQTNSVWKRYCDDPETWKFLLQRDFNIDTFDEDPRRQYLFERFVGFELYKEYSIVQVNSKLTKMGRKILTGRWEGDIYGYFDRAIDMLPIQKDEVWTMFTDLNGSFPLFRKVLISELPERRKWFSSISGADLKHLIGIFRGNYLTLFPVN